MTMTEQLPLFDMDTPGRPLTAFSFRIFPAPAGFIVSATADCLPVRVSLREWAWEVKVLEGPYPHDQRLGLVCTRSLVDAIAAGLRSGQFTQDRATNVRVKYGRVPRTARIISGPVHAEIKRLLDLVPPEVTATQRAVFAATFETTAERLGLAAKPELYGPEYAMLRRDIRRYRAAAAASADAGPLVRETSEREIRSSGEFLAAAALAARAGLRLYVARDALGVEGEVTHEAVLGRLAADWRGLYSPDGRPYRSLDRTLMNLPGGVPHKMLHCLAGIPLARPVTDRVELTALLAAYDQGHEHEHARQYLPLFLHAERSAILRAMETVAAAIHVPASPRRSGDIRRTVAYLSDYPDGHRGHVTGLARKAVRWHRQQTETEAAETVARLGDQPARVPPVPLPEIPGVTFLAGVGQIAGEGAAMGNCVASYAESAVAGRCYLFHVDHRGEAATVEVSPQGHAVQAEGPRNKAGAAARWGARVLARWARGFPDEPEPAGDQLGDPWAENPF